ncbi:MAG: DEAD/DEAH box helicase [Desulfotomaculaceae bacterium]|nr:DEAD/DEAH box helicase [Desulfotomaculaceae bacterium]
MKILKDTVNFGELKISRQVYQALADMGFEEPTPIQQKAVPLLFEGKDVIGQAQTGTGKTAAFGVPIIEMVNARYGGVQALIVTPTRELAIQVAEEISRIGKYLRVRTLPIYGGQSIDRQIRGLKQGVQVVIGTPGRLLDHLSRKTLWLDNIKVVVLDEADEMLDMGFIEDIESILQATPPARQTLLFSATMPEEIRNLARKYLKNPEYITVSKHNLTVPQIEQVYYETREPNKLDNLCRLLDSVNVTLSIIFCRTKRGVDELVAGLQARGYPAAALHGDLSQYQRNHVMRQFKTGQIDYLVATDVAARGLDIENISHVINYDIPQDPEFYVHRIGRTGRAGKSGVAVTLVGPRDYRQLKLIERLTKTRIRREKLPSQADIYERQKEGIRERIHRMLNEGKLAYYRNIVDSLVDEYDPMDIAAAALKLSLDLDEDREDLTVESFGNTGARSGMVRLFINIGRKDNIATGDLVRIMAEETGMPENSVGNINIYEKFSFVEVPEEWANCVISCLHRQTIRGRRVSVEPARGKG